MQAQIKSITKDSIAADLGLVPGAYVCAVNGRRDLEDLFDYEFEVLMETDVLLEVRHPDETVEIYDIEKDAGEDLGIQFSSPIFTPIKTCNNACPFCFIDQQPEGLRPSLYVKDDDYRLSYFCSTYITLTNLTRHDRERMARIRPGPLYVSVHATTPAVRERLLLNPKAGNIMAELAWLAGLEIPFHAQLVICPGLNDGDILTQSLQDLATLRPHCLSVAIVPLGLTQHRGTLPDLQPVTAPVARDVLDRLATFSAQVGDPHFAFASDEFYVLAEVPIPNYLSYGDFPQLDDGVGTARHLLEDFLQHASRLPERISPARNHMILTGQLGGMILDPIARRLNAIQGLHVEVLVVRNDFWGHAVTVAGLITGQDIVQALQDQDLSGYTSLLIPETMLKSGEAVFLDEMTVTAVSQAVGCPIVVVPEPTRAELLLVALGVMPMVASRD